MPSRRRVLQGCGVALSAMLAGCAPGGQYSRASLSVGVEAPFESTAPYEVPVGLVVHVESVGSKVAGARGLALVALDEDREPVASASLPDVTYESASPDERTVRTPEADDEEPVYEVQTRFGRTLTADRFPAWLSVRADRVWAGGEETPAQAENRVALAAPPPPVEVVSPRYRGGFPPPDTVEPADYEEETRLEEFGSFPEPALLPDRTATPTAKTVPLWHDHVGWRAKPLVAAAEAFGGQSRHDVDVVAKENLGDLLDGADEEEGPLLLSAHHRALDDHADHLTDVDARESLALSFDDRFVGETPTAVHREGDHVGVPWAADTTALLYNRELVESPPATAAALQRAAADHHDPEADRYGLGHLLYPSVLSGWVHAFGGYYYDRDAEALGLTAPQTVEGLRFVLEELFPLAPEDPTGVAQVEPFKTGRTPFVVAGAATARLASEAGVDVGAVPLPTVDRTRPRPHVDVTAMLFTDRVGYRRDPGGEAVYSFAEYYATSDAVLSGGVETTGVVPVTRAVAEREATTAATGAFVESVERGRLTPSTPRYDPVPSELYVALKDVVAGEADLEPALADAEGRIRDSW
jgi:arabinogalactan oligomer/maltooligosaccharide transport system substrate-binding protein